jgi:hypothetical protein
MTLYLSNRGLSTHYNSSPQVNAPEDFKETDLKGERCKFTNDA